MRRKFEEAPLGIEPNRFVAGEHQPLVGVQEDEIGADVGLERGRDTI